MTGQVVCTVEIYSDYRSFEAFLRILDGKIVSTHLHAFMARSTARAKGLPAIAQHSEPVKGPESGALICLFIQREANTFFHWLLV